jgi:hypothetical protein
VARFDRTIPPGGEGRITLELKTVEDQGQIVKSANVFSNDPKQPELVIGLKGKIWAPVLVTPRHAKLNGVVGDTVETVVYLQGQKKEPLMVKLGSISIPDKVEVDLKEVEEGRSYELNIRNRVQGDSSYTGKIKLTTNYPERSEIQIKIHGNISPPIEVRPKALNFGGLSPDRLHMLMDKGIVMRRPVSVILNRGEGLKINKAELEKSIFKVISTRQMGDRRVQLQVEAVLEKLKKGLNVDHLRIYTNQTDEQALEVPVQIQIP